MKNTVWIHGVINKNKNFQKQPPEQACNFIKKEPLAQAFSCKFCEISKNTFSTEHLWTTVIIIIRYFYISLTH